MGRQIEKGEGLRNKSIFLFYTKNKEKKGGGEKRGKEKKEEKIWERVFFGGNVRILKNVEDEGKIREEKRDTRKMRMRKRNEKERERNLLSQRAFEEKDIKGDKRNEEEEEKALATS